MNGAIAMAQLMTPMGAVIVSANDRHLLDVRIMNECQDFESATHPILKDAVDQIEQWFDGQRTEFDLPLAPPDSEESKKLRLAIAAIPYGQTQTYGILAKVHRSSARAVGQACKTNPYPIIIPCHRVVSTQGPEYYSAGQGARTKGWLLDFESSHLPSDQRTRLI